MPFGRCRRPFSARERRCSIGGCSSRWPHATRSREWRTTGIAACCGCARAASGHAAAPPSAASNSRRPMVTVIRPSRARCVRGRIPRRVRAVPNSAAPGAHAGTGCDGAPPGARSGFSSTEAPGCLVDSRVGTDEYLRSGTVSEVSSHQGVAAQQRSRDAHVGQCVPSGAVIATSRGVDRGSLAGGRGCFHAGFSNKGDSTRVSCGTSSLPLVSGLNSRVMTNTIAAPTVAISIGTAKPSG